MAEKDKAPALNPGGPKGLGGSSPPGSAGNSKLAGVFLMDEHGDPILITTGYTDPDSSEPMPAAEPVVEDFEPPDDMTDLDVVKYLARMIKLLDEKIDEMEGRLAQ